MIAPQIYTLDGSGSEIPALNVFSNYTSFIITGTAIAIGNYNISSIGTPIIGTSFNIFYEGNLNITSNSVSFSLFGTTLNQVQLQTKWQAFIVWDGTQWVVNIYSNFAQAILTQQNFTSNSIPAGALMSSSVTTTNITNGSITNPLMANNSINTLNIISQAVTNSKLAPGPNASIKCTSPSGIVNDISLSPGQVLGNVGGVLEGVPLSNAVSGVYETINAFVSFESGQQGVTNIYLPYSCTIINMMVTALSNVAGTNNGTVTLSDFCATAWITDITIPASTTQSTAVQQFNINYNFSASCGNNNIITLFPHKVTPGGNLAVSIVVKRT